MAGPKNQIVGEVVRPKFNWWSLFDVALGTWVKGDDGLWYLNGGFSHVMCWSGQGNTFKSTALSSAIHTICWRYNVEWASKYDTEVSAELSREEMARKNVFLTHNVPYEEEKHSIYKMIEDGKFNFVASDMLPGEQWWADYIRDEVEGRFKSYIAGKGLQETPFPDPIRKKNRMMLNPWIYGSDSMSEWQSSDYEDKRDASDIGDKDQNALAATIARQKAEMMSRWANALSRGHMYLGFTVHLAEGITMGKYEPRKALDDVPANLKFANVPKRALTFLTNSFLVATSSGTLDHDYDSKRGVKTMMFPTEKTKGAMANANDLKIVRYQQIRAKGGPTGVKFDMVFSQELGFQVGLSEWYYLKEVMEADKTGFGVTRTGNHFELHLAPGIKFQRTTVRDMIEDNIALKRALELTAIMTYEQNNRQSMPQEYRMTPQELYDGVVAAGFDWNEIYEKTVHWWMFKGHEKIHNKHTLTYYSLCDMALGRVKPKFLTCTKK